MKIDDVLNRNTSLLGADPSGVDVEASNGEITASRGGKIVGALAYDPKSFAIIRLDVSDVNDGAGSVATALMRKACELADRAAATVIVPDAVAQVPSVSATRFVERFGFVKNSRGQLVRKPGGALPFSVLL